MGRRVFTFGDRRQESFQNSLRLDTFTVLRTGHGGHVKIQVELEVTQQVETKKLSYCRISKVVH